MDAARDQATHQLAAALPGWQDPACWPGWRMLLPHIDALASHAPPNTDTDTTAFILNQAGLFLEDQGQPGRAAGHLQRAFADYMRVLGPDHPATLGSRNDLAGAYRGVGDLGRAIPLYEQTVAVTGDAATRAAVDAAWTAQHQYGGALLGEHLGQLLVIGWSVTLCVIIVRTRVLPRWLGFTGLAVSALYLLNQGDILATAVPGFPVWDLAGPIGSTGWGLWVAALGVTILLRPAPPALPRPAPATRPATAEPRS